MSTTKAYVLAAVLSFLHSTPGSLLHETTNYEYAAYETAAEACVDKSMGALNPSLCAAMGFRESRWQPEQTGVLLPSGLRAKGMLQVTAYARRYIIGGDGLDMYDAHDNVLLAGAALTRYAEVYGLEHALCHYAGGDRVCASRYARSVRKIEALIEKYVSFYEEHDACWETDELIDLVDSK